MAASLLQRAHEQLGQRWPAYLSFFRRHAEVPHDIALRFASTNKPYHRVYSESRSLRQLLVPTLYPATPAKTCEGKRLAVIVPYRDRQTHLRQFIAHMEAYLGWASIPYHIYVIEQLDDGTPFNRGKLLNVGFLLARDVSDYCCLHDVDLLPVRSNYAYPERPTHLLPTDGLYSQCFGGVTLFNNADFEAINGFDPDFWHWGGEDDALFHRCHIAGIPVCRLRDALYHELPHDKSVALDPSGGRPRSEAGRQALASLYRANYERLQRFRTTATTQADCMHAGLNTTRYVVLDRHEQSTHTRVVVDLLYG